jgi:MFS family permease
MSPPRESELDLRETFRKQMLNSIGGWSGALITAVPTAVFIIVNIAASLSVAIYSAVGSALALTVYRLARRQSIQQSISGLFGVLVAAVIAARTGQARGFFLLGIWTSFAYAVPFGISVVVRRPLVGVLWEFLDPSPEGPDDPRWYKRRPLLVAYTWATLAVTAVFLARGIVQAALYHQDATGWLAFARIAMGYPLFIAAVGFSFWVVQRARRSLPQSAREHGAA